MSLRALAKRYGINPKTVAKWKKRTSVADVPTGPKNPSSTVLTIGEEAVIVAFRRHTLLLPDDCLYALQPTSPPDALTLGDGAVSRCNAFAPWWSRRLGSGGVASHKSARTGSGAEQRDVGGRATGGGEEARRRRLAAALRENLKRRKTQARGRSVADAAGVANSEDGVNAEDAEQGRDAVAAVAAPSPQVAGDPASAAGAVSRPAASAMAAEAARDDAADGLTPGKPVSHEPTLGELAQGEPILDEPALGEPASSEPAPEAPTAVETPGEGAPADDADADADLADDDLADVDLADVDLANVDLANVDLADDDADADEELADDDTPWRVRLVAAELEAERIAALIERAVEADGWPVTRYELPPARAGDDRAAAGGGAPSARSVAVEAGAGAPAFAARLVRDEDWPWAVEVLVFSGSAAAARARILDAVGGDGFGSLITVEPLQAEDWVAKSLEGLPPVREGRFLVRGRHARGGEPAGVVTIDIEAGLAFGTGHHATTVGCLAAIERVLRRRRPGRPLDLGTGTGVLAIALARLAKVAVVASDIDPVAVTVAAANARANGVGPWVRPFVATGLADRRLSAGGFDLVVANILARPLERLAPAIGRALSPRATVILSGLRVADGRRVEAAYRRQGLVLTRRDARDGWLTLTFWRSSPADRRAAQTVRR